MSSYRQHDLPPPVSVDYAPPRAAGALPYEVVDRSSVLAKKRRSDFDLRQRPEFHQLVVVTAGEGSHIVDFEPVEMRRGTVLRIHPGQVQRFVPDPPFDATMLVWPSASHREHPAMPPWFPGSDTPTRWQLDEHGLGALLARVDELREEQQGFDGSEASTELLVSVLHTFLLRLDRALPAAPAPTSQLPQPYLDFRTAIEEHLFERPSVSALAASIGYSTRTLDRVCDFVEGNTAKQVLDERVSLEVRRLLTHTDRSVASIGLDFGFDDASNFSKFVKRLLGQRPSALRDRERRDEGH